ncbi:YerC/YecD family TrpR-related protein [Eubacteriaceae bacterium ES3]|nr:YerC/YecD family TrpR-related protein [Eubacteriaceae bacterium ES3]
MEAKRNILAKAFLALSSEAEVNSFFDDLCTIREVEEMANRFEIAILLSQGKTFTEIEKQTGASSATISRVNRCLKYGKGYQQVIERINLEDA